MGYKIDGGGLVSHKKIKRSIKIMVAAGLYIWGLGITI